jgi:transposase
MRTSQSTPETISTIGIDDGKNTFHLVGLDKRGEIVLQAKGHPSSAWLGRRLSNIPRCLIGMETCSGTHFIGRQLSAFGHDVRLIPANLTLPMSVAPVFCHSHPRVLQSSYLRWLRAACTL